MLRSMSPPVPPSLSLPATNLPPSNSLTFSTPSRAPQFSKLPFRLTEYTRTLTNNPATLKTRVKSLPHLATSVLVSDLQIASWEFNLTTTVAAAYSVDERIVYARFPLPIGITDFIRGHVIPIGSYGQNWKAFTKTTTHTIPTKTVNNAETYRKIVTEANFGVIDVKGLEIVSCSRAIPVGGASTNSGNPDLILLYGKITPGQVLITLKAQSQSIVDAVGTALKQLLSNK